MKKPKLLLLVLFMVSFLGLYAQDLSITGKVTDENRQPLPGVTIIVSGTARGTITDENGNYSISAPGTAVLEFSFIGYQKHSVSIEGTTTINVTMSVDFEALDEVVVIGYGSVKKSDLTGSVVSLKSEDIIVGVSASVDHLLQGRAAGVQVLQNSSEPGGGLSIQVRGVGSINASNEPLYVIDGLPVDNVPVITGVGEGFTASRNPRNPLNSLNPADIESIEILKDASSTAIYGSRGANGVIMITTKKGTSGSLKVDYDAYFGTQSITKKLDLLNATEYQQVLNELYDAGAINANVGERVDVIQGDGTDWQDEIFRQAPVHNHNLSFSGGDKNTRYYASFSYFDQDGVVISSGIKRYSARLNLEQQVKDRFNFGLNISTSFVDDDFVANGIVPNEAAGVISSALDFDPTLEVMDENTGRYNTSEFISKDNPLAVAYGKEARAKSFRTFGSVYGEYFFIPELSLKINLGGDINTSKRDVFIDSSTKQGNDAGGIGTVISGFLYNYLAEATMNYRKEFGGGHSLSLLAGATTQQFFIERSNVSASGFISEATGTNSLQSGTQSTFSISTSSIPHTLLSYLGRANYSFQDRFLVTATIRADGSSRFGENNKFGYFPSAAFAWKLNNEDFIKNLDIFSTLKLRASWGRTGNQEIGNYRSLTTFSIGNFPMIYGDNQYVVFEPSRMPNPDLKWETTEQTDIGLDFGFLQGRISGSIDYFYRKTFDLLLDLPVPPQTGFATKLANVGSVENKGWEFVLNTYNITGPFSWTTNMNFSVAKNKVIDLGGIPQIIMGALQFTPDVSIIIPGQPMNSYYGYTVTGVWQTDDDLALSKQGAQPGDLKYLDANQDSTITASDRAVIGSPFPDFTWGMVNTFAYKGFDLSVSMQGVHGAYLLNNQMVHAYYPINFRRNKIAEPYLNRWTPENPTNEYPSFINPSSQGSNVVNTRTVEDASYIRIQNVTLGYQVPLKNVKAIRSLNVYVSASNLHTFTKYRGFDPGANVSGNEDAAVRIDYDSFPLARTMMFGFKVGF